MKGCDLTTKATLNQIHIILLGNLDISIKTFYKKLNSNWLIPYMILSTQDVNFKFDLYTKID